MSNEKTTWLRLIHWFASKLWLRLIPAENGAIYLERHRVIGALVARRLMAPRRAGRRQWFDAPRRMTLEHRLSIYLHRFRLPDQDTAHHSHPWWGFSIVLAGGYTEERLRPDGSIETRRLRPGSFNFLGRRTFHKITELHGAETWTLFVCGPKTASWGFMVPGRGFTPWRERLRERGILE